MISQWLFWLNCLVIGILMCIGISIGMLWMHRSQAIIYSDPISKSGGLPKGAFRQPSEAYAKIGAPLLTLLSTPPSIQLPDLRQQLIYYGKNGRPDAQSHRTLLHFGFNGNKAMISASPGEKIHLIYEKKNLPFRYTFSPENEPTSLWMEATPLENEVLVRVFLKDEKGELITEPETHAQFKLTEKEFTRQIGTPWEISSFRVDGTLLARQRARWYGPDHFLERHGGEEYQDVIGRQRIDFGEQEAVYSVFVSVGDCLIWHDQKWKVVQPGEQSLNHPLLVVKKIEERLMTFELWDVEGKGKVILNLLKSIEPWALQNAQVLQHMFKFVGARTKTQYVFEINQERVLISPSDWLLIMQKGWKKLSTADEIEEYVKRKLSGSLFVFEGITRKEERQVMVGTLYNPARSDYQTVEIPLQPSGAVQLLAVKGGKGASGIEQMIPIPNIRSADLLELPSPIGMMPGMPQPRVPISSGP